MIVKIVAIVCQIIRNYTIFIQCNDIDESNAPSSIDWRSLYGSSACDASNLTTFFAQYKFDVKIHFQLICLANASFAVSFCVNWANCSVCEKLQFHFRLKVRYTFLSLYSCSHCIHYFYQAPNRPKHPFCSICEYSGVLEKHKKILFRVCPCEKYIIRISGAVLISTFRSTCL